MKQQQVHELRPVIRRSRSLVPDVTRWSSREGPVPPCAAVFPTALQQIAKAQPKKLVCFRKQL